MEEAELYDIASSEVQFLRQERVLRRLELNIGEEVPYLIDWYLRHKILSTNQA